MAYNMTAFTDSVNVLGMFSALNDASGNLLAYMLVVGVFITTLMLLLRNNPPAESFAASSTVLTVFSLMFLLAELINIEWVIGATVLMTASVIKLYFK